MSLAVERRSTPRYALRVPCQVHRCRGGAFDAMLLDCSLQGAKVAIPRRRLLAIGDLLLIPEFGTVPVHPTQFHALPEGGYEVGVQFLAVKIHVARFFAWLQQHRLAMPPVVKPTKADIHRQYRERSREAHPDQGGSVEAFLALRQWYEQELRHAA
jgi:hypothetical protein